LLIDSGAISPGLIDPGLIDPGLFDPGRFNPGDLIPFPIPEKTDQLVCEAFMQSAIGPASIGTRSKPRYAFVRWVEANDSQHIKYVPYTIMIMPVILH